MPTCPLCEHVQASGEACEVCGRAFPVPEEFGFEVEPPPLPELEPTPFAPTRAPDERMADLEPNQAPPVMVVTGPIAELEPTAAEGLPQDLPAIEPEAPTCRYCATRAAPGEAFCSTCGMHLPVAPPRMTSEVPPAPHLCTDCGTPVRGDRCPACGARAHPPG